MYQIQGLDSKRKKSIYIFKSLRKPLSLWDIIYRKAEIVNWREFYIGETEADDNRLTEGKSQLRSIKGLPPH